MSRTVLITGGCGFIGVNLVRLWRELHPGDRVINLDALTYAGNLESLADVPEGPRYRFVRGDICDAAGLEDLFAKEDIHLVLHLAAESHVDRSILGPEAFIQTNVVGTFQLLEAARRAWADQPNGRRFVYVSTDEVYGDLGPDDAPWTEDRPLVPSSPYSASKASGDHLAHAYAHTYGMDVVTTHCSNNYGPYQFPEKLIPLMILNALERSALPVYGDGQQRRDWIHVEDHCRALVAVADHGRSGAVYNVGSSNEMANLDVVHHICDALDVLEPGAEPRRKLIQFVTDRPGHDRRYAIDSTRIQTECGWSPTWSFEEGMADTVRWYLDHSPWWESIRDGAYRTYYERQYGDR